MSSNNLANLRGLLGRDFLYHATSGAMTVATRVSMFVASKAIATSSPNAIAMSAIAVATLGAKCLVLVNEWSLPNMRYPSQLPDSDQRMAYNIGARVVAVPALAVGAVQLISNYVR